MATLFSGLSGSAFTSPVGQRIEKATDAALPSEDWALIMEICDVINETDDGPKDAMKAIRKRLSNHKNSKSIMYTLTIAEACVKNCGKRFHVLVASKDFLNDLTKLLSVKGQPSVLPRVVQEKVLSLIQAWCDAFKNASDLQAIKKCYDEIKAQGHEFPAQDLDTLAPIFTPGRSELAGPAPVQQPTQNGARTRTFAPATVSRPQTAPARQGSRQAASPVTAAGPIMPSPEQLAKLRRDLDIVEGNVRVMSEMLTELKPGQEDPNDWQLLHELNKTCRQMQQRVVELLNQIANEEVTGVLLKINDDLNNQFIRYDRYERNRKGTTGESQGQTVRTSVQPSQPQPPVVRSGELIEFGVETSAASGVADDEFDMFAQSRSTTYSDSQRLGSTYHDNSHDVPHEGSIAGVMSARGPYPKLSNPPEHDPVLADDIQDIEEWLKNTDLAKLESQEREARLAAEQASAQASVQARVASSIPDSQSMTSSEFDQFLSERSVVGSQRVMQRNPAPPRQMENFAGTDRSDHMFGL